MEGRAAHGKEKRKKKKISQYNRKVDLQREIERQIVRYKRQIFKQNFMWSKYVALRRKVKASAV